MEIPPDDCHCDDEDEDDDDLGRIFHAGGWPGGGGGVRGHPGSSSTTA